MCGTLRASVPGRPLSVLRSLLATRDTRHPLPVAPGPASAAMLRFSWYSVCHPVGLYPLTPTPHGHHLSTSSSLGAAPPLPPTQGLSPHCLPPGLLYFLPEDHSPVDSLPHLDSTKFAKNGVCIKIEFIIVLERPSHTGTHPLPHTVPVVSWLESLHLGLYWTDFPPQPLLFLCAKIVCINPFFKIIFLLHKFIFLILS